MDFPAPPDETMEAAPSPSPLHSLLAAFRDSESAWPEGLRWNGALADLPQVLRLKDLVKTARSLDTEGGHAAYLSAYETRLNILVGQLKSDTGRCFF